jgi:hypothetical protein
MLSLTVREEHKLQAFENKMLRNEFASKKDEVSRQFRKLHSHELHGLFLEDMIDCS